MQMTLYPPTPGATGVVFGATGRALAVTDGRIEADLSPEEVENATDAGFTQAAPTTTVAPAPASAPEPVVEPAPEPVVEPAPEPVVEPAPEPVVEPAPPAAL